VIQQIVGHASLCADYAADTRNKKGAACAAPSLRSIEPN
jgi:hypothetical protein